MEQRKNNQILLHACCGICSGYPISFLQEMGYEVVVYFSNSNLDTKEEFEKRLDAQKTVCEYLKVKLIVDDYNHQEYLSYVKGLEKEPERGARCDKCIELRLNKTSKMAKELNIPFFTTSLVISPHKNFKKISDLGAKLSDEVVQFVAIDFKKKDGFLKTNQLSKTLGIYRQNYCGCEFAS
jgi:hypothetical protein